MAAVTICSDFGAQKNKVWHYFHCFPIHFPWSDGTAPLGSGKSGTRAGASLAKSNLLRPIEIFAWREKFNWVIGLLPPSPGVQKTGKAQVPLARKHRASSDKPLSVRPWIHYGLCGQYTAQNTSEHKESIRVIHVRLTPGPPKPQDN